MIGAAIYTFLTANLDNRVYPLTLPQGVTLPARTYQLISEVVTVSHSTAQDHPVTDEEPMRRQRIQFNSYGRSYDEMEAADAELYSALVGYRGYMGDVWVGSVSPALALDDYEPGTGLWRRIRDLNFAFRGGVNGS